MRLNDALATAVLAVTVPVIAGVAIAGLCVGLAVRMARSALGRT